MTHALYLAMAIGGMTAILASAACWIAWLVGSIRKKPPARGLAPAAILLAVLGSAAAAMVLFDSPLDEVALLVFALADHPLGTLLTFPVLYGLYGFTFAASTSLLFLLWQEKCYIEAIVSFLAPIAVLGVVLWMTGGLLG
jgi:hypothetical protein